MTDKKFCLIVNPYACNGYGLHILKKIEKELQRLRIDYRAAISNDVHDAKLKALDAAKQNETIVVVGGDGSLNTIVEAVKDQNTTLAIIPTGRGNDFARKLNYPIHPIKACSVLANGKEKVVDMGEANQKFFLGICSLGFDSVANEVANRKGSRSYLLTSLCTLMSYQLPVYKIEVDDHKFECEAYTVAVANSGCYARGLHLVPQASLEDGLLDVMIIGKISKPKFFLKMGKIFNGTHIHEPNVTLLRGRKIHIECSSDIQAYADGEAISAAPLDLKVLPSALKILCP